MGLERFDEEATEICDLCGELLSECTCEDDPDPEDSPSAKAQDIRWRLGRGVT